MSGALRDKYPVTCTKAELEEAGQRLRAIAQAMYDAGGALSGYSLEVAIAALGVAESIAGQYPDLASYIADAAQVSFKRIQHDVVDGLKGLGEVAKA